MWIKICANTSAEDALAAAEAGADAVGFVFAPSPRQVTAAQVRLISDTLPPEVERVGVFVQASVAEIATAVEQARLHTVQLHGGIDTAFARQLAAALGGRARLIQSVGWEIGGSAEAERVRAALIEAAHAGLGERVLIDAKVSGRSGGLGVAFHWEQARPVFAADAGLDLILAGGLRPEHIGEAIRMLQPWGVDVASGVESEPGRKDHARVRTFIANARAASLAHC